MKNEEGREEREGGKEKKESGGNNDGAAGRIQESQTESCSTYTVPVPSQSEKIIIIK